MATPRCLYVGQKAFIERGGKVLVLYDGDLLDMPGGRIDEGEYDLEAALKREVREETGLEIEVGEPFRHLAVSAPGDLSVPRRLPLPLRLRRSQAERRAHLLPLGRRRQLP